MTKLICPDCRHENEPERIYCHNCGGRLDRSAVKKEIVANEESTEVTQKRLKDLFNPTRGRSRVIAVKAAKIVLGAFCLAAVIQMLLPPNLPAATKSDTFAPMINMDLLSALETHNPPRLTYSAEQVNAYMVSAIRRSNSPAKAGFVPIQRIFVQFDEGACAIGVAYNFFGVPLFNGSSYTVAVEQGNISANSTGGYIGRMPIHPSLMRVLGFLFSKTWNSLDRERKQVAKLAGIEFHPGSVTLITAR